MWNVYENVKRAVRKSSYSSSAYFPTSIRVQVRWPPSWKIGLRIQLSFGFWGRAGVHRSVPQWSHFQTASNKPLKLCLICMSGLLLLYSHLTREPTTSPVLTKWWNWELMLATNFGSLSQTVTKVDSQNFGYQFWFCTRLLRIFFIVACRTKLASWRWWMILASSSRTSEIPLSPVMTLGCVNLSSI